MSQKVYHHGDKLDQAFDIYCQSGHSSEQLKNLADRLGIEPDDLKQRWGMPVEPAANVVLDDPDYLWRADDAQEVL